MFTAADLVDALRSRRTLRSIRPETPGQLPEGWRQWLDAMPARPRGVSGAPAPAFVDAFLLRAPPPPPRPPAFLGRGASFATLFRQAWSPPSRDERGVRITGMATSITLHVLLSAALVWLMDARFLLLPPVEDASDAQVVRVEFIGRGTPEAEGGAEAPPAPDVPDDAPRSMAGAAPSDAPVPQPTPSEAEAAALAVPPVPERGPLVMAQPRIDVEAPPVPERPVPPPAPAQPLAVGEQARPDDTFLLPPPTPRMEVAPVVDAPQVVAEVPEVRVRDVPEPLAAPAIRGLQREPGIVATVPTIVPELRDRPVAAPEAVATPDFRRASRPATTVAAPRIATRVPEVAARDIPAPPSPVPDTGARDAPVAASDDAAPSADAGSGPVPAAADGVASAPAGSRPEAGTAPGTTAAPGRGPDAAAPPGAWPSTMAGDDWGAAARDRPGAAQGPPGLFDEDGRPRLADGGGVAPGTFEEHVADFGNAGEWMQRPAYPYEPTRFDRFWIPGGTLLEEWVRRGIRELMVPIPGTSKRLKCVVSVLQLGGGCWVSDPNLNEQPSTGRPAPEVPFRPELFEDPAALESAPPGG